MSKKMLLAAAIVGGLQTLVSAGPFEAVIGQPWTDFIGAVVGATSGIVALYFYGMSKLAPGQIDLSMLPESLRKQVVDHLTPKEPS